MNYIVLVKQVPDIKNIPEEAWDWEKGILKRGLLDNVCNELDKQALSFAIELRQQKDGIIVSLTMGPTFADAVLRYSLSIGADIGVLLTDKKLGGADTAATAYPLAQTIRKIEKEIFHGDRTYIVISGMQSIDGDTAQVPPQIAEDLGIAHIAYATSFSYDANNHLLINRITRQGTQTVSPLSYPCMITVTNWTLPYNASFQRTRWAFHQNLYQWSAADIDALDSRIGLAGSRTTVFSIFSPRDVGNRKCIFETDLNKLVVMLQNAYREKMKETNVQTQKSIYNRPPGKKPYYDGEVWLFAETEGGEVNPASYELLGKSVGLAEQLQVNVGAVCTGKIDLKTIRELISYGANKVYIIEHEMLVNFLPVPCARTICELIDKYHPQMMLFSATPLGRELAPRVAYRVYSGLTADCTNLEIFDYVRGNQEFISVLKQTRPALGGNIMASIITQNSRVQMSTVRPGVMKALQSDEKRSGEIVKYIPEINENEFGVKILNLAKAVPATELKDAAIIVSGGGGCKTKEVFSTCVQPLADALGGLLDAKAIVGASRVAVEMGLADRSSQIGQTGQTVKPRLYVAVGISGAVQHVSGMQNSDIVLAINKDSGAKIFKEADFGVVGDINEIVPELIRILGS